jgi:FkbM family methyltransferase
VRLVRVGEDAEVFATSAIDARFLYAEIFSDRCYGELDLPERALVFDIGANIGLFTLYTKECRPSAQIRAFEPAPESADALHRNIARHALRDVRVHQLALGCTERDDVSLTYYPLAPCNSTIHPAEQQALKALVGRKFPARVAERMFTGREIRVSVARLSRFLTAEEPVELMKIDAVGSEFEILHGIDAEHWPLIRRMIVDVQDVDGRLASLCEFLAIRGLEPTVTQAVMARGDGLNYLVHATRG